MPITQGEALPSITTSQQQTTAAPSWYTDYLSNLSQQGITAGQNAQFVGASPLQQQAFQLTGQNVGNYQPSLTAATNLAGQVGQADIAQNVAGFMSPYTQQVVDALGNIGRRNIEQYLAPQATAAAVGSGQFGSKRGAEALGRAVNEGLQNLNLAQSQALQTGYGQALTAAQQQQANRLAASQQLGTLAQEQQALGLGDVNALATIGSQQQQIDQARQLFPLQVAAQQAGLLRGYTVPTSVMSSYTGPIPGAYSASPLQQVAGIASLLGALNTSSSAGGNTPLQNIFRGISDIFPSNWGSTLSNLFGDNSGGGGGGNTNPFGGYSSWEEWQQSNPDFADWWGKDGGSVIRNRG